MKIKNINKNKLANEFKINKEKNKKKNAVRNLYRGIFFLMIVCIFFTTLSSVYAIGEPTLVRKINSAFKKIKGYLVDLSTPIAGVAIASGVIIRKLSFGDEEKMAKGKKIIINAIIGYAIILLLDVIIKFLDDIV